MMKITIPALKRWFYNKGKLRQTEKDLAKQIAKLEKQKEEVRRKLLLANQVSFWYDGVPIQRLNDRFYLVIDTEGEDRRAYIWLNAHNKTIFGLEIRWGAAFSTDGSRSYGANFASYDDVKKMALDYVAHGKLPTI